MSAQTGNESAEASGSIVDGILGFDKNSENYKYASHIVRKCAHFLEYTVLSVLLFISVMLSQRNTEKYKKTLVISFLFSVIYAGFDEIHQLFVPGERAG